VLSHYININLLKKDYYIPITKNIVTMILMDDSPFLLYFLLSYSKNTSQNIASCWVRNTASGFGNSSSKGGTDWWLVAWLTHWGHRTLWILLKWYHQGLRMSADVSLSTQKVLQLPKSSLVWLGQYILYCINTRPCLPNKIILSTYLDICLILKLRIPFGTWMFYLRIIQILHTDSLRNIHNPYNPSWLLCTLLD